MNLLFSGLPRTKMSGVILREIMRGENNFPARGWHDD